MDTGSNDGNETLNVKKISSSKETLQDLHKNCLV